MDVSSDSRLAAARKRECPKCAKYDRIKSGDELDGRTVCCGCMQTHRDYSVCFSASLRMDDSRFHYGMCNDCVHTLTVEAGSDPLLRTFKTFSVPGAAAAMGRSDAGGSIPEGVSVDLGNGVMVTATTTPKMGAEEEKEKEEGGGGGGGGEDVECALPPPVVNLWSVRRVAAKAKAAYAALPSASAGVAVTAAAAAAAAAVAGAARSGSSASASYTLKPVKVAEVGGGGGAAAAGEGGGGGGARGGGGVERSPRDKRPKKLDDVLSSSSSSDSDGCDDKKSCKSSSDGSRCRDGSGSTAPNSLEETVKFFSDGGSSRSSGRDGGGGGSLGSASRTSSSADIGVDMNAAGAATAVAASLQEHRPKQQQQQQKRATPSAGVRARAQALERKIAGFEDAPTLSMDDHSETLVGVGGRSISGSSSSGFIGNLSGRAVVVAGGGHEGGIGRACGSGDGWGGAGGGEGELEKEREQGETGGGRRSRLFYCGVAAIGVGLVGAAVWAFGGRPSRR